MKKIKAFFIKEKVVIMCMISAAAVAVQQFTEPVEDYRLYVYAALVAALGVVARNLRGQWPTIIFSVMGALTAMQQAALNGNRVSWLQLTIAAAMPLVGLFLPPAKSINYERSPAIHGAKLDAQNMDAAQQPPISPPVENQ